MFKFWKKSNTGNATFNIYPRVLVEIQAIPFTATHSMISTYLGNITIVLKLPLTSAASTNGLQRYSGFWPGVVDGDDGGRLSALEDVGKVAEVGVGERLLCLGALPRIERLHNHMSPPNNLLSGKAHPIELKNDMSIIRQGRARGSTMKSRACCHASESPALSLSFCAR